MKEIQNFLTFTDKPRPKVKIILKPVLTTISRETTTYLSSSCRKIAYPNIYHGYHTLQRTRKENIGDTWLKKEKKVYMKRIPFNIP